MRQIRQVRELPFPAEKLWNALADFGGIHRFHPMVRSSPLLNDKSSGVGSQRRCEFYQPGYLVEEIIDWKEGQAYTVRILDTPMPIKDATATFQIVPNGETSSTVSLETRYRPKFGPLGWLMDRWMMRRMMNKAFAQVLKGLEDHLATGKIIGKNGELLESAKSDSLPEAPPAGAR